MSVSNCLVNISNAATLSVNVDTAGVSAANDVVIGAKAVAIAKI